MLKDSTNQEIGVLPMGEYLIDGVKLCFSKECRLFVILPILINFIVLFCGSILLYHVLSTFLESWLDDLLPEFLAFLTWIIGFILVLSLGFVFCFIFSTVATLIASPFYGLLAERAEGLIRGVPFYSSDEGLSDVFKDIPRILSREMQKLWFYIPRVLLCIIITVIPVVNVIAPLAWFLLASWMMAIQYTDYAYDNHKTPFALMRKELATHKLATFTMGTVISLCMTVPVLNLIIPPAAVCAGTRYYVEIQRHFTLDADLCS